MPRKLGFRDGQRALFLALPDGLRWLSTAAAFATADSVNGTMAIGSDGYDLVHAFFTRAADLEAAAIPLMRAIKPDGAVWVSWPKKASKRPTDITEDVIRDIVLPLGLVDVKVCAVDEVWSGLKLVVRKEVRPGIAGGRRNG